ncbi:MULTISPECIES: acetyl-CoA carboxylase carboxyltransferase subunit alpha [Acidiphilium]|jgi:acetyl-CoA carboxylase carboxyl transferase subunit alpha|uniref:Acetyl-coenzyme A carboxylase carboxyl transferase subunit alpha n=2 Tax=Acidiphilium TaxID=522 RepID=ACCA_ACICJ|nr:MULTISPECIES: acetyl-CoA carboxylase carboxyltransferase subunit alpha [Acidiphilium]A5G0K5.1 RecName: Full=Acetyl-coenzyme A carboxylase carboxyl transferase subunit alpha; Short=ACCase subunit alpha; Short=Acetyl-CoA carboxylase carboxyltransferase subunit alpha [Acidiphilium cryptum JF-5]MBU6357942.1 acetyl-CoA carboxylase carboxyltransferase subunit alpha [Rhodospirillales bacterium]ABQ31387.1 acetyl-CoA carboxylase carboxyltransferase subunit alpha [Acidiphilium cryptum JF-5]EGO94858.1 
MRHFLDFEKPVAELEAKIEELRRMTDPGELNIAEEVTLLSDKAERQLRTLYGRLSPWQKTQVARHPERPKARDVIAGLITEFTPLAGDRGFGEDAAIVAGPGRFKGEPVMVIAIEKGWDLESRLKHNFGSPRPEGYRKARRLIEMAGRFGLPVLSFVDTSGAYPGVDAEARGQAEAIARGIDACLAAPVPFIATIIGEGGSGGAIAIAAADTVLMFEHAIYSVISPEGCAAILWEDRANAAQAAEAMKITAQDLKRLGIIDRIVPEPLGGAHRDPQAAITALGAAIAETLPGLAALAPEALRAKRREKFLAIGQTLPV